MVWHSVYFEKLDDNVNRGLSRLAMPCQSHLLIRFDKSRQPVMGWLQRTFERNNAHKTACFACRLRQPLAKKDGPNIQQIVYHVQQCFYRLPADARLLVVS